MLPNVGQGANQAFEDAYVLSRWLQAEPNAAEAFRNFRRVRIPRVHAVQHLAVERAQLKNMQDAAAQKAIFARGKQGKLDFREWLWGYDPVHDWEKEPKLIYGEAQRR
jgi:salicylate hydroxylase